MADTKPDPAVIAGPFGERARNLKNVSRQLADMISLLKADRDRLEAQRATAGEPDLLLEQSAPAAVRAELARLREEQGRLRLRLDEIEELRRSAADDLVALQEQIAQMVGLHVALRRLHEAADRAGVIEAIREIVVNVVGSEDFALLAPGRGGALQILAELGGQRPARIPDGGPLTSAMERGALLSGAAAAAIMPGALACVPLRARGRPAGLLLVFGLLPQKPALGPADLEVFELLQVHGALALRATEPERAPHENG